MWFAYLLTVVSMANGLSPTTTDSPIVNPPVVCKLDGKKHPVGSFTPADRCQGFRCINDGTWEYDKTWPTKCNECATSRNTNIKMYREHSINGSLVSSYEFERSARTYTLTQSGIKTSSQLQVNATFEYTNPSATKSSITKVVYKEPGITVEFDSPGPSHDAKILVYGEETSRLNHNGSMTPFNTGTGWVYISNDSPNWPRPNFGGNIHIVGTQGLAVSIFALHGYAHFVHIYAKDHMKNLYGLCDVMTVEGIIPDYFTERSGGLTNSTDDFVDSWKDEYDYNSLNTLSLFKDVGCTTIKGLAKTVAKCALSSVPGCILRHKTVKQCWDIMVKCVDEDCFHHKEKQVAVALLKGVTGLPEPPLSTAAPILNEYDYDSLNTLSLFTDVGCSTIKGLAKTVAKCALSSVLGCKLRHKTVKQCWDIIVKCVDKDCPQVDSITVDGLAECESPDENPWCTCGVPSISGCRAGYCVVLPEPCPHGVLPNCNCGIGSRCCRNDSIPSSSEIIEENIGPIPDEPIDTIPPVGTCGLGKGDCGDGMCIPADDLCDGHVINNCQCQEHHYCCGSLP